MNRLKGLLAFWAIIIGAELAAAALVALVFALSPVLRERAFEAMLVPNSPMLRSIGANQLRHYPSRAAAIALIAMLNLQSKDGNGQEPAQEALASLRQLSGEPFQDGWKDGDAFDVPTSPEAWNEMMTRVNSWAFNAFGPDAMASLSAAGLLGNGSLTVSTQAGGTAGLTVQAAAGSTTANLDLSYSLSDDEKISLSFGNTSGLAEQLDRAGIDPAARFARSMMAGDTVAVREILDDVMEAVGNGDTAEAAGVFRFFGLELPNQDAPAEPAAPEPPAQVSPGATASVPFGENAPPAEPADQGTVIDGETEGEE